MPRVAHHPRPAFEKLRQNGEKVLSLDDALRQDIRELHVGLLNMMPDAALTATEMQFMRLVGSCNQIAQFFVYPFTLPALPRGPESQAYVEHYYKSFDDIRSMGLDALIVTGANVTNPSLDREAFWEPLKEVMAWAYENVTSVLCSCLATHALVKQLYISTASFCPAASCGACTTIMWCTRSIRCCATSTPASMCRIRASTPCIANRWSRRDSPS